MRKCWIAVFFALYIYTLGGCGLLTSFYQNGENGEPSTAETVQTVVRTLPYGDIIAWVIGLGGLVVGADQKRRHIKTAAYLKTLQEKHDALLAAGKKDDNNNGVDDATETPPAAPTV